MISTIYPQVSLSYSGKLPEMPALNSNLSLDRKVLFAPNIPLSCFSLYTPFWILDIFGKPATIPEKKESEVEKRFGE